MDKSKIIKMVVLLMVITIAAGGLLRMLQRSSLSLAEYEKLNSRQSEASSGGNKQESEPEGQDERASNDSGTNSSEDETGRQEGQTSESSDTDKPVEDTEINGSTANNDTLSGTENPQDPTETPPAALLTGASLNGSSQTEERVTYEEGFYYEPISDNLRRYITGISYPGVQVSEDAGDPDTAANRTNADATPKITLDELRYVHILHYDFDGYPAEGELICNEYIAQDLVEIFYELFYNEYRLEKVLLIDEYDGDDVASMEDNNTSCFNYRVVAGSSSLSKHAYGLAIDINPLYNPYVTYGKNGAVNVSPVSGESYADRSSSFPYKIDEEDLCYKLFIRHGFTWGGNWNHSKDYQHFQKTKP